MLTVDIHQAESHLSELIDRAANAEPFVIAKAGRPLVKVTAARVPEAPERLGFLAGEIAVPDEVDCMGDAGIVALFAGTRRP